MTSESNEDAEAVLSDVDSDEPSPVALNDPPRENAQDERVTELIAELDREKKAREAAESSKSELQASFNRLKALAHEVIKKREESKRERDEALKEKESLSKELESVSRGKDEMRLKLDEVVRDRDGLRGEIESSSRMLVSGIEKISGKVSSFKSFSGLPKSQKYTGLASVAYGVIKRTNEIVEELVRQIDMNAKSRNEAREQMDQRSYEIAIEVSQLESTISNLRLEVAEKASVVDDLERDVSEKDKRIGEVEKDKLEKVSYDVPTLECRQPHWRTLSRHLSSRSLDCSIRWRNQGKCNLRGLLLFFLNKSTREETSSLRKQLDSHTKELNQRMRQIEELKEKERLANDNVEGLMTDIAAAEEEIARWKVAAEQEAAAGGAVEQDFTSQLLVLKEELEEAKQAIKESEKKLKFKKETAAAAMGARDAAERSLRLADNRATSLRERIQELNGKVEELETNRDMNSSNRARYVCWPWQLLGIDFVGGRRVESEQQQQSSNEMELAEPLL
ncbi:hypothetical protein Bca52824_012053 [Brassica carinata]|uniref:Uncharacterized protein n=1 Tax=Brassica carinata TaxID=52824 RepID=A0A8X7VXY5_BRACI|nr:hypothetical protein Bca52824_012053 [Brassica carinata]